MRAFVVHTVTEQPENSTPDMPMRDRVQCPETGSMPTEPVRYATLDSGAQCVRAGSFSQPCHASGFAAALIVVSADASGEAGVPPLQSVSELMNLAPIK